LKIGDDVRELDYDTLTEWIRAGKLGADDQLRSTALTGGEWKRAGELRLFYILQGREIAADLA